MAVVGKSAATATSQWDTKKNIAYSHVAHLGVDSVLFALVSDLLIPRVEVIKLKSLLQSSSTCSLDNTVHA